MEFISSFYKLYLKHNSICPLAKRQPKSCIPFKQTTVISQFQPIKRRHNPKINPLSPAATIAQQLRSKLILAAEM